MTTIPSLSNIPFTKTNVTSVSQNRNNLFTQIHYDGFNQIFSYLDNCNEMFRVFLTCKTTVKLRDVADNLLERQFFSRITIFDQARWEKDWKIKITNQFNYDKIQIAVLRKFLECYYGKNPLGLGLVRDNCLIPTIALQQESTMIRNLPSHQHEAIDETEKEACIVILLKTPGPCNKYWSMESEPLNPLFPEDSGQVQYLQDLNDKTKYGCEIEPDALSVKTALLAHSGVTKNVQPFANPAGEIVSLRTQEASLFFGHLTLRSESALSVDSTFQPNVPKSNVAVPILKKIGLPEDTTISSPFITRTKFFLCQSAICIAKAAPFIGPLLNASRLAPSISYGPTWRARHLRCSIIGAAVTALVTFSMERRADVKTYAAYVITGIALALQAPIYFTALAGLVNRYPKLGVFQS